MYLRMIHLLLLVSLSCLRADPLETLVVPQSKSRVPDRSERIDIVWPSDQGWTETGRETQDHVQTISFVSETEFSHADITTFYGMWDADYDKARRLFVGKVRQECDSLHVQPWVQTNEGVRRTIQVYECHSDQPYCLIQLLLQGVDNFYAVEVYHPRGIAHEGQLLPWIELFKDVNPCYQGGENSPCNSEIWPEH